MNSLEHWLPGGIPAQGMRRRPMQASVSCFRRRTTACDLHVLGGAQCGEPRGPDLQHSETKTCEDVLTHPSGCADLCRALGTLNFRRGDEEDR